MTIHQEFLKFEAVLAHCETRVSDTSLSAAMEYGREMQFFDQNQPTVAIRSASSRADITHHRRLIVSLQTNRLAFGKILILHPLECNMVIFPHSLAACPYLLSLL